MNYRLMVALVLASGLTLSGCGMMPGIHKQKGEIDLKESHALKPKDHELYQVKNLEKPGGQVFLFSHEDTLANCYTALAKGKQAQETCSPEIVAHVPDGALVRTLNCHQSQYAICTIQVIEGESGGASGAIMWDWLQPRSKSKVREDVPY